MGSTPFMAKKQKFCLSDKPKEQVAASPNQSSKQFLPIQPLQVNIQLPQHLCSAQQVQQISN